MFFVAVEIRDNPSLADKPVAVGSMSMISTSNYVARKFGVRAAMPGFVGLKLCPQLKLISGHYHKYREESNKITEVMKEYDETFTPYSLDECSIDLTSYLVKRCSLPDSKVKIEIKQNENGDSVLSDEVWQLAEEVVQEIRQKVFDKTKLTCSAGISVNKMLSMFSF
jgi:DNA polymerase kappa